MVRRHPGWRRAWSRAQVPAGALCAAACLAGALWLAAASLAPAAAPAASVSPATAWALDAGVAQVHSVSGVLVLDAPSTNPSSYAHRAFTVFAATSAGDRKADAHYAVDWAGAAAAYRKALLQLRQQKPKLTARKYASQLKELRLMSAVPVRDIWVQDAATHTSTWAYFSADPLTRRLWRARYIAMPYSTALPPTPDHTDSWRVWELASQLRAAMEADSGVHAAGETRDGVAGYRVDVPSSGGVPAWSAFVDRATGLTLSVARAAPGGSDRAVSSPYHVRDLRVNEPPPAGTFSVHPDYRVLGRPRGLRVDTLDLANDPSIQEQWLPPDQLARVAPASQLVPYAAPAGFQLSELRVIGPVRAPSSVALIYTRGLSTIYVGSGQRLPEATMSDDGSKYARPDHMPVLDRAAWPVLGGLDHGVDAIARAPGGVLAGDPAALAGAPGETTLVEVWNARYEAWLAGDATRGQLLAMAGSLHPLQPGAWHRPTTGLIALIAVLAAAASALATLWAWARALGTAPAGSGPRLAPLAWPLAGAVVLVAGACFDWHALRTGLVWGVRGWDEPLGRWVLAAALAAVTCAAWTQLAASQHRRQAAKTGALFLSLAALAGAAFALVYLPLIARFTVPATGVEDITQEGWLLRIVASRFSPSAAAGLYVSMAGALLLCVGVLLLRRRTADSAGL